MTRPIERYVRCAVDILGPRGYLSDTDRIGFARVVGVMEIGLQYMDGERPSMFRDKLIEVGDIASRVPAIHAHRLDEDIADEITRDLEARMVALWGDDRGRFIEVWRGASDDVEPLSQTYAPCGMPRTG